MAAKLPDAMWVQADVSDPDSANPSRTDALRAANLSRALGGWAGDDEVASGVVTTANDVCASPASYLGRTRWITSQAIRRCPDRSS
jgi:hypothetical protein